jgi:hypothetical protein
MAYTMKYGSSNIIIIGIFVISDYTSVISAFVMWDTEVFYICNTVTSELYSVQVLQY